MATKKINQQSVDEIKRKAIEEYQRSQTNAIMEFAKPAKTSYPQVKDSGEVRSFSGSKTRDQFKEWFESNIGH